MSDADAIRGYIVRHVTLTVNNEQSLYWPVRQAAIDAVRDNAEQFGMDRDGFLMMLGGRGQIDRREVAEVVGSAVSDTLQELLVDGGDGSVPVSLLGTLLDLGDRDQQILFGEHYMPEAADWPAGDEDDN